MKSTIVTFLSAIVVGALVAIAINTPRWLEIRRERIAYEQAWQLKYQESLAREQAAMRVVCRNFREWERLTGEDSDAVDNICHMSELDKSS